MGGAGWRAIALSIVALALTGCAGDVSTLDSPSPSSSSAQPIVDTTLATPKPLTSQLQTPEQLLDWMAANPGFWGMDVFDLHNHKEVFRHRRTDASPIAAARGIIVLGAYAEAVAAGTLKVDERVQVSDVERYNFPGADGGAHAAALADMTATGRIAGGALSLDDVAYAMLRWGDPAATDYLQSRVGGTTGTSTFARFRQVPNLDAIGPVYGERAAWATLPLPDWAALSAAQRANRASQLAVSTTPALLAALHLPTDQLQRQWALTTPADTPQEMARLMDELYNEKNLDPAAASLITRQLEWSLKAAPDIGTRFAHPGIVHGDIPGVVTETSYLVPVNADGESISLMFRGLPADVQAAMRASGVVSTFCLRLADDVVFLSAVATRIPN